MRDKGSECRIPKQEKDVGKNDPTISSAEKICFDVAPVLLPIEGAR